LIWIRYLLAPLVMVMSKYRCGTNLRQEQLPHWDAKTAADIWRKVFYCLIAHLFTINNIQILYKEKKAKAKDMQGGRLWWVKWAISELLEDALLRRVVIWRVRAFST
jgi:hypothetical protein